MNKKHDPLTDEEALTLATLLDNTEELLKVVTEEGGSWSASVLEYRRQLSKWVDRLCQ